MGVEGEGRKQGERVVSGVVRSTVLDVRISFPFTMVA